MLITKQRLYLALLQSLSVLIYLAFAIGVLCWVGWRINSGFDAWIDVPTIICLWLYLKFHEAW